jgi:hypothetical protein
MMGGGENMNLRITEHAKERYAERIAGRDNKLDAKSYVATNGEKIVSDLTEMVERGKEAYRGPLGPNKKPTVILIQGTWLLVMSPDNALITLFKKDLGLSEKLNQMAMEEVAGAIAKRRAAIEAIEEENQDRLEQIADDLDYSEARAKEHRKLAKELDDYAEALRKERLTLQAKENDARADFTNFMDNFVGERYFGIRN